MTHETMAGSSRRFAFLRRLVWSNPRNCSGDGRKAHAADFVRRHDGTSRFSSKTPKWRSAGSQPATSLNSYAFWGRTDERMRRWFDSRPLLLPYIAFVVTLELFVLVVKL